MQSNDIRYSHKGTHKLITSAYTLGVNYTLSSTLGVNYTLRSTLGVNHTLSSWSTPQHQGSLQRFILCQQIRTVWKMDEHTIMDVIKVRSVTSTNTAITDPRAKYMQHCFGPLQCQARPNEDTSLRLNQRHPQGKSCVLPLKDETIFHVQQLLYKAKGTNTSLTDWLM